MQMPALQELKTPEYLRQLQQQSTDQSLWEVGASCNFLIAAARLGMSCSAVANLGKDVYGRYLLDILQVCTYHFFAISFTATCIVLFGCWSSFQTPAWHCWLWLRYQHNMHYLRAVRAIDFL